MKTSRYSDSQILAILKQNEQGVSVNDLCREHGMSSATFYKWRAKSVAWMLTDEAHEGVGGREPAPEDDICR